ncbi:MAG: transcriptional repressor [Candidatus Andersenbacteria bacterium]
MNINLETWRHQLQSRSHKATTSRLAVLTALQQTKQPLSVQRLMELLSRNHFDQATVYRTLATLKHLGLVRQIEWQHGHAHYELASLGDHHHVICRQCHSVEDVRECNLESMTRRALRQSGFAEITEHSLEFFGLCQKCKPR